MTCIDCDGKTIVYDSVEYSGLVFRKRKCKECGCKFYTQEDLVDKYDENLREAFRMKGGKKNV